MRLTDERTRRRWSLAELARRAGMNPATVGLIESGRFQPYESQLRKIAQALGLPEAQAGGLLKTVSNLPMARSSIGARALRKDLSASPDR